MPKPFSPAPAKALVPVTSAQAAQVLPLLEDKWSVNALGVQQRFAEAVERDDAAAAQKWAIAGGISTEKVLLMKGRPTEIVGNLHLHRHDMSQVMDKLAQAARVVQVHAKRGYHQPVLAASARVIPSA